MGQAKKRGTFEERKAAAIEKGRALAELAALNRKARLEAKSRKQKEASLRTAQTMAFLSAFAGPVSIIRRRSA